jgi:hypothetical protein
VPTRYQDASHYFEESAPGIEIPEEQAAQPGDRVGSQEAPGDVSEMSDEELIRIMSEAASESKCRKEE